MAIQLLWSLATAPSPFPSPQRGEGKGEGDPLDKYGVDLLEINQHWKKVLSGNDF